MMDIGGCVLNFDEENQTQKVKFLRPHAPSSSFCYSDIDDILNIPVGDVILKADCRVNIGRVYNLSKQEIDISN